jgi:hypothetical protein
MDARAKKCRQRFVLDQKEDERDKKKKNPRRGVHEVRDEPLAFHFLLSHNKQL